MKNLIIRIGITAAALLFASSVRARDLYVSTTGSDAAGGTSFDNAFETIPYAISRAEANDRILIAPGVYTNGVTLSLNNGISLVGCGETRDDVVLVTWTTSAINGLKIVSSPDSVVTNLSLTNRRRSDCNASGISMNSGLLVDCRVFNWLTKNNNCHGGGINMTGGTVRSCEISNCDAKDSGGAYYHGEGICMSAGLVENCVIAGNGTSGYGSLSSPSAAQGGGGVYMTGGTVRGCLIRDNVEKFCGSGVSMNGGGVLENCTIVGNRQYSATSSACGLSVYGSKSVVRNNIIWGNVAFDGVTPANVWYGDTASHSSTYQNNDSQTAIPYGTDNISVDPLFVDAANRDYHVRWTDCADAGVNQDWMADAVDMDGCARIYNERVDMGCYEFVPRAGELVCKAQFTSDGTLDEASATLKCLTLREEQGLSVRWILSRQEDGVAWTNSGVTAALRVPTGVWDVRMEASNTAGQQFALDYWSCFNVRASVAYANVEGIGVYPYATLETGSPSVDQAFQTLGEGGMLIVADGIYTISNQLTLASGKGSRVVSLNGPEATVIRQANCKSFVSDGYRSIRLQKADAYVSGLTLVGGQKGEYLASSSSFFNVGLVSLTAAGAMVTNCVLRDSGATYGSPAACVTMSAGTIVDCTLNNVFSTMSGGGTTDGGALFMTGGLADRLRVVGCRTEGQSSASGNDTWKCAVIALSNGAKLSNSLVARCIGSETDTVTLNGGTVVNCTVVANTNTLMEAVQGGYARTHGAGIRCLSGTVQNCISADNWSKFGNAVSNLIGSATYTLVNDRDESFATEANHNVAVAPEVRVFRDGAAGDYRLCAHSPALDVGLLTALGPDKPTVAATRDVDGKSRLTGAGLDLGAYEYPSVGLFIYIR